MYVQDSSITKLLIKYNITFNNSIKVLINVKGNKLPQIRLNIEEMLRQVSL